MLSKMIESVCRFVLSAGLFVLTVQAGYTQGTAFSYQGRLLDNGQPAMGNYDLTFTLFPDVQAGASIGPVVTNLGTPVNSGLFTVLMDFGAVFNGSNYWLEIGVRPAGNSNAPFTTLQPRQYLTPVPYAVYAANAGNALAAGSVPAGGIVGTIAPSNLTAGIAWQTPTTTMTQGQPNTAYLVTNAQQATVTLPAAPSVGDVVEVTGIGAGGWLLAQNPGQTIQTGFSAVVLPGDLVEQWTSIASSSNGTELVGATAYNGIWISTNAGTNWTQSSGPSAVSIVCSPDGTRLAAATSSTVWISTNAGKGWAQAAPITNGNLSATFSFPQILVSSADGTRLAVAAGNLVGIFTSTNSGGAWSESGAPTNQSWTAIAGSSNLSVLAALPYEGIWISTNFGSNWTLSGAPTNISFRSLAMSADGTRQMAASTGTGIWISTNAGTGWAQTGAPALNWLYVSCSSDGTQIFAALEGAIWMSTDSGATWNGLSSSSPVSWTAAVCSADGARVAALTGSGGIWTFINGAISIQTGSSSSLTESGAAGFLEGGFGTSIKLLYTGSGRFIALSQTGLISGH